MSDVQACPGCLPFLGPPRSALYHEPLPQVCCRDLIDSARDRHQLPVRIVPCGCIWLLLVWQRASEPLPPHSFRIGEGKLHKRHTALILGRQVCITQAAGKAARCCTGGQAAWLPQAGQPMCSSAAGCQSIEGGPPAQLDTACIPPLACLGLQSALPGAKC